MALATKYNGVISQGLVSSGIGLGFQQYTLNFKGELIASNAFNIKVDGVAMTTVNFATSNSNTLKLICTQLLADFPDFIKSAVPQNNVDEYGGYSIRIVCQPLGSYVVPITNAVVTGGASQIQVEIVDRKGLTELFLVGSSPFDILLATRQDVDGGDSTMTYYGYALPGSVEDMPVWAIKRVTTVSASITTEWAEGIVSNEFIWDDRETLNYL